MKIGILKNLLITFDVCTPAVNINQKIPHHDCIYCRDHPIIFANEATDIHVTFAKYKRTSNKDKKVIHLHWLQEISF